MERDPSETHRRPKWAIPLYVLLFTLAIPWYFPTNQIEPCVLGIPLWAAVSLACSAMISALTAYLALKYWPPSEKEDAHGL